MLFSEGYTGELQQIAEKVPKTGSASNSLVNGLKEKDSYAFFRFQVLMVAKQRGTRRSWILFFKAWAGNKPGGFVKDE